VSNVTLAIAGRQYTVSCADGEEAHIEALGRIIAAKAQASGAVGNEQRTLLFAALMLADELEEARRDLATLSRGLEALAEVEHRFARLAEHAEALAQRLEHPAANP